MKSLILLGRGSTIVKSLTDWDWAELQLIKLNEGLVASEKYSLFAIPFEGDAEASPQDIIITRSGAELSLSCYDEDGILGEIELEQDWEEELFHQHRQPRLTPTYKISRVHICDVNLDNLSITDELKRAILSEAEAYRDEMIEQLKEN